MHHEKSPKHVGEQDQPEPERLITPEEEAGMALEELENPPQAEGPRKVDEGENAGGAGGGGEASDAPRRGD